MKLKHVITFSVILALSFSIIHEYAFSILDENKCNVSEYITEFDAPNGSDDICDTHYEYHHASIFPPKNTSIQDIDKVSTQIIKKEEYNFSINPSLVIPPIA